MRKWLSVSMLLLSALVLVPPATAAPDAAVCLGCHGTMEGAAHIDQAQFTQSVHGSLDCVLCHVQLPGDQHAGLSGTADQAIRRLAASLASKDLVDPIAEAACVQCHPDIYRQYEASIHGQNIMVQKSSDGPVCTTCHGSPHAILPQSNKESRVNHFQIVKTCGTCHEEKSLSDKYGLSEDVMERYKDSFHGRKLRVGLASAPSCADCHGAHDIISVKDPSSPVYGPNKIKTCGKCHPGATAQFVSAITHQPPQPIAHWTEIGLIILTVSVFLFICIHVLLDIIADIRERLFRKGDHHE